MFLCLSLLASFHISKLPISGQTSFLMIILTPLNVSVFFCAYSSVNGPSALSVNTQVQKVNTNIAFHPHLACSILWVRLSNTVKVQVRDEMFPLKKKFHSLQSPWMARSCRGKHLQPRLAARKLRPTGAVVVSVAVATLSLILG